MAMKFSSTFILAATLVSLTQTAIAQQAEELVEADGELNVEEPYESNEVLDLYGFTDSDESADPVVPEPQPEFGGVPDDVQTVDDAANTVASEFGLPPEDAPVDVESNLLDALDDAPEPFLPDEVEADADYLESNPEFLESYETEPGLGNDAGREDFIPMDPTQSSNAEPGVYIDPDTGEVLEVLPAEPSSNEQEATGLEFSGETGEPIAGQGIETQDQSNAERIMKSLPGARIRALDKISGAAEDVLVEVGQTVAHKGLDVTVRACYQTPPEELPPESAAYVEVLSNRVDTDTGSSAESDPRIFAGWMFASSPGLNAMEHPIYDVWVINCSASAPDNE